MDVNDLKKLMKNSTAVLVLDNGEPSFVVMGYENYKNLVSERGGEKEVKINHASPSHIVQNGHERESEILERLNKEILALKSQIEMEEKGLNGLLNIPGSID